MSCLLTAEQSLSRISLVRATIRPVVARLTSSRLGNRFMTSLGNIEATPMASLTFVDFESGDILCGYFFVSQYDFN